MTEHKDELQSVLISFQMDGRVVCASPKLCLEVSGTTNLNAVSAMTELLVTHRTIKRAHGRQPTKRETKSIKMSRTARTILRRLAKERCMNEPAVIEALLFSYYAAHHPPKV